VIPWLAPTSDLNLVRAFALAYTGVFAIQQIRFFRDQRRFIATEPPRPREVQLLGITVMQVTPRGAMRAGTGLLAVLLGALATNLLGLDLACRCCYGAAFLLLAMYHPHIAELGYVIRKILFAPVVFVVLAFSPGLVADLASSQPAWPLGLLQGYLALVYASTGLEKAVAALRPWWRGDVLRAHLLSHHLWGDMPLALFVANRAWLCRAMSFPTLVWEVTFPLALFVHPIGTMAYVLYGIAFHVGTAVLMRIHYHEYWFMNYLVFLPQLYLLVPA
jgi:hypothetical protein